MKLNFKKLDPRATAPTYGSEYAAGADLRAVLDAPITIKPNESTLIHTGIAVEIPDGFIGLVFARSGIAMKRDLAPANKVGVIDSDYRGEIKVALHNHGEFPQVVDPEERVAQLVIMPYIKCQYERVEELSNTSRGEGGFGSTGAI